MSDDDPVALLFGGMGKLGPGDDAHTLEVLRLLPRSEFGLVVDAGCGSGRQTLALAAALRTPIDAVDTYEPFLNDLSLRAREAGLGHLVRTHCMDVQDISGSFRNIDLLWCEGAAYNIGFVHALRSWAAALAADGLLVVSELSWLWRRPPERAKAFFAAAYPDMRSVQINIERAENAGYRVLTTHTLPREAWVDGYYAILRPRAASLMNHASPQVRDFASDTLEEIDVFEAAQDSYGYVFYLLEPGGQSRRDRGDADAT